MPKKFKKEDISKTIYFKNLDFSAIRCDLKKFFEKFGSVKYIIILYNKKNNEKTGSGFVTFIDEASMKEALSSPPEKLQFMSRTLSLSAKKNNKYSSLEENESPIEKLFPELLVHIFSFIPIIERLTIEKVCKKWQYAAQILWKSETTLEGSKLGSDFDFLSDKIITKYITRCPNLRVINLIYDDDIYPFSLIHPSNNVIKTIADHCPKLEEFYINNMNYTPFFRPLAKKCPNLEKIEVPYKITESEVWWIFNLCKKLKSFKVTGNERLRGHFFHIANPQMVSVELFQCGKLTTSGLTKLVQKCRELEVLAITDCSNVTDAILQEIVSNHKKLRKLSLDSCGKQLRMSSVWSLVGLAKLELLSLANMEVVNDSFVSMLCLHSKDLRSLNLAGTSVTNTSMEVLSQLRLLTSLNICQLPITSQGLEWLAQRGCLEELFVAGCRNNLDDGIMAVVKSCPRLRCLDVSGTLLSHAKILHFVADQLATRDTPFTIYFEKCTFPEHLLLPNSDMLTVVKKIICGDCTQREYGSHSLYDDYDDEYYSYYVTDSYSDVYPLGDD